MKTLNVVIEWSGKNYGAYAPEVGGCVATAATLEGIKEAYASALEFHREGCEPGELPAWVERGEYELDYTLEATALLHHYSSIVSLMALSRATGIHHKQLSHYLTGHRRPRPDKRASIIEGLHSLGRELLSVR